VDVGCYVRVVDVRPSYVIVRPLGPEETQFLSEASS